MPNWSFNAFAYRPDDPLLGALLDTTAAAFGRAWRVRVPGFPNHVVLASAREADLPLLAFAEAAGRAAAGKPDDAAWAAFAARPESGPVLRLAERCAAEAVPRGADPAVVKELLQHLEKP